MLPNGPVRSSSPPLASTSSPPLPTTVLVSGSMANKSSKTWVSMADVLKKVLSHSTVDSMSSKHTTSRMEEVATWWLSTEVLIPVTGGHLWKEVMMEKLMRLILRKDRILFRLKRQVWK